MNSFGRKTVNGKSAFDELVRTLDAVRPAIAEMLTRKAYHKDYGIFDHDSPEADPLDLVRMHPKENVVEGGPERTWIRKFVNYKINDIYGLSLLEFFELPFNDCLFMIELAESKAIQSTSQARQIEKDLGLK
ncbi:hypothetical protein [Pseudomonas phage PA1C]|uniref:Uncharacterized protein n=1 Tax=Pseudomonas phage vB_PaeM_PS119XW TaxID=2601632 RepID=A0A5C1K6Q0_9CAUD|nr:hypothetical protein PP933_gp079 [Pseudomonas phage vB_PaeM_PS119XW]QBX32230.1 hypothetical protein [Pseudomonas phage PA1C]QEM41808.1 hypothetical protein [Pseudomonas phage vB_PaeM_PS119XW]BEG72717.1 hypothetical protein RVBP21_3450 [Pseudomonas phage BRkr]